MADDVLREENHSATHSDSREPSHDIDWTLVVESRRVEGQKTLHYSLTTRARPLEDFGSVVLERDLQSFFKDFFRDLDGLDPLDPASREDFVQSMGHELANQLLPRALNKRLYALRALRPGPVTAQILTDEYAIPWELLRIESGGDGFYLGEEFALGRWRRGGQIHLRLPVRRPALVAIRARGLAAIDEEIAAIEELFERHRREARRVTPTFAKITAAMASGMFDGWHFMGHGSASKNDPDQWSIPLEDSTSLTPRRLYGRAKNLGDRHAPLVFMNSCHSGKGGQSLTRIGGWADRFLELGAGAFVGASWQISDGAARDFALAFYQLFLDGTPIGEAARQARLAIRQRYPGDPSWLAYAVFAHPGAVCADEPVAAEEPEKGRWPVPAEPQILLDDLPRARARSRTRSGSRRGPRPGSRTRVIGAALAVLALAAILIVFALSRNREDGVPAAGGETREAAGSSDKPVTTLSDSGQTDGAKPPPSQEITRSGSPPPPPPLPPPASIPLEPIQKGKVGVAVIDKSTLEWSGDVARIVLRKLRDQLAGRSDLELLPVPQALRPRLGEIFEEDYSILPGSGRSPYGLEYIFLMAESHGPHAAARAPFPTVSVSCEMALVATAGPEVRWSTQLSHLGQKRTEPEALDFAVGNCIEESSIGELF